ncbi:hypothetical protein PPSIR1_08401 [Plesiocystis pacifica SIR-1]|uniref:Lipoprotein n=1 Tax=Plesiocystis pacifica SIR-1 TaxID=391625 RepID=A6GI32_9BACT|nr:hypothetical protein [Plesiocystis pacifica]EDM74460.1 hypothetical protein PPSIR1_08401 [Plesiocystis pacifica SIR-1]
MNTKILALSIALGVTACLPSFDDRPWLVDEARVLAIRSTPAEAKPGEVVHYEALIADPDGLDATSVSWSFCLQPRTADERGAVTHDCAIGEALSATPNPAALPMDACARFGPNSPPTEGDEPPRRPADPDPSGGYAIPIHAAASLAGDETMIDAFAKTRIRCDLVGATRPVFDDFEARYTNNENPALDGLVDVPASVAPGASLDLRLRTASGAAEAYVLYELERGTLRDVRETLSVRWYVSDGVLERGLERASELDAGAHTFENTWTAPSTPGLVRGWVVVADDRGGASWASWELSVD